MKTRVSIPIEVIGSQIIVSGGSIYPKEDSYQCKCPKCDGDIQVTIEWDNEACEFHIFLEEVSGKSKTEKETETK